MLTIKTRYIPTSSIPPYVMSVVDPFLIAHPPSRVTQLSAQAEEAPFEVYCIVCDKRIVQIEASEKGKEGEKKSKKKMAGGTIRVKNPDGTTTTRNANGKVIRPPLKRNPNSSARIVVTNAAKGQSLNRTETNEGVNSPSESPQSKKSPPLSNSPPFKSAIYCSRECMETDAGRSTEVYKDLARTMSFDFSNTFFSPDEHIPVTDQGKSPNAPPSPLFISGSDTESSTSNSAGLTHDHNTSSSAPKIMDYFRFSKEDPDRAWHEVERQRRSSMQPALRRPAPSTESLTSLWHQEAELGQSSSGGGKLRAMTPLHGYVSDKERRPSGSAERSAPIPVRPIPRSNLSHTSLVGSSSSYRSTVLPADLGSAPSHTLGLLHSYASAFSVRSSSNTPSSYSQRGFVYPDGTVVPSSVSPPMAASRTDSTSSITRPVGGTIKARKNEPTWDSFGKVEVQAHNERIHRRSGAGANAGTDSTPVAVPRRKQDISSGPSENTPRQNLEREGSNWKITYVVPASVERQTTVKRSQGPASSLPPDRYHPQGVLIPRSSPQLSTSTSTAYGSHTPSSRHMPLRAATSAAFPDIGGLKVSDDKVVPVHSSQSVPRRIGFNWDQAKGVKTYEIPGKVDRNPKGLFYFQ
ncbi:hypothetical protein J008_02099 [Cryptococcus neoformans]|nr:hypothetical protein J008_02099 [Cryptococcus neoformans var. grubii]